MKFGPRKALKNMFTPSQLKYLNNVGKDIKYQTLEQIDMKYNQTNKDMRKMFLTKDQQIKTFDSQNYGNIYKQRQKQKPRKHQSFKILSQQSINMPQKVNKQQSIHKLKTLNSTNKKTMRSQRKSLKTTSFSIKVKNSSPTRRSGNRKYQTMIIQKPSAFKSQKSSPKRSRKKSPKKNRKSSPSSKKSRRKSNSKSRSNSPQRSFKKYTSNKKSQGNTSCIKLHKQNTLQSPVKQQQNFNENIRKSKNQRLKSASTRPFSGFTGLQSRRLIGSQTQRGKRRNKRKSKNKQFIENYEKKNKLNQTDRAQREVKNFVAFLQNKDSKITKNIIKTQQKKCIIKTYEQICFQKERAEMKFRVSMLVLRAKQRFLSRLRKSSQLKKAKAIAQISDKETSDDTEDIENDVQFMHGMRIEGEKLIQRKKQIRLLRQNKNHVIYRAAQQNNFQLVQQSNRKFSVEDVNIQDDEGNTPLYYTLKRCNAKFSHWLLSNGADPNMILDKATGNTAVHLAFQKDNLILILLVLQFGADLYKQNKKEMTALDIAKKTNVLEDTMKWNSRIIKKAKDNCYDLKFAYEILKANQKTRKKFKRKNIQLGLLDRYLEIQRTKFKIKVGQIYIMRQRKLFRAVQQNDFKSILNWGNIYDKIISEDCQVLDGEGKSCLCYAMYHQNIQFIKFLLARGADVNIICESETGNSAIHLAFDMDNIMILLIILQVGANLNALNHKQQTPINLASKRTLKYLNFDKKVKFKGLNLQRYDFQLGLKEKIHEIEMENEILQNLQNIQQKLPNQKHIMSTVKQYQKKKIQ